MKPFQVARPAEEGIPTSARIGVLLLATSTLLLSVALFLPWWRLEVFAGARSHVVATTGFSGWGWLSFIADLVALVAVERLLVTMRRAGSAAPETSIDNRMMTWTTLAAGGVELLGNFLFIIAEPKSVLFLGGGTIASYGIGLVFAIVCGFTFIICGLLIATKKSRGRPSLHHELRLLHYVQPAPRQFQMPCPE